jgi:hypothetical protein
MGFVEWGQYCLKSQHKDYEVVFSRNGDGVKKSPIRFKELHSLA